MYGCKLNHAARIKQRKTVKDCYFMDSCACGFETRGFAPQTVSPRRHISSHEMSQSFPMFCLCSILTHDSHTSYYFIPKTKKRRNGAFYFYSYSSVTHRPWRLQYANTATGLSPSTRANFASGLSSMVRARRCPPFWVCR